MLNFVVDLDKKWDDQCLSEVKNGQEPLIRSQQIFFYDSDHNFLIYQAAFLAHL